MKKLSVRGWPTKLLATGCVLFVLTIALTLPLTSASTQTTFSEGFEAGGKTSYAAASATLGTGSWLLDDALIGSLANDRKTGSLSVRVRNAGVVRMNFNKTGAGAVSIQHAVYGNDDPSNWQLWSSTNDGGTWTQVGANVTTNAGTLQTATFTVNSEKAIRFEIRKVSGGASRLNIDNIQISNFGSQPKAPPTQAPKPAPSVTPAPSANLAVGNSNDTLLAGNLTMGNPSNAVASATQPLNYLIERPQYAESYNRDNGEANWVSWHLDGSWLGNVPRQNNFRVDTSLPLGWYQVQASDYKGSGYDRGHMCPSADRTVTITANSATFLMTNMIPQLPANNQRVWASLENYCRSLVSEGDELYIVSGGQGIQYFIADGHVAVPAKTWKVIIVQPNGNNDLARVNTATRTIAVVIPNAGPLNSDWRSYRVSVDQVESLTGFDFFSNVPVQTQAVIEAQVDNQ
jgi:endonuclease G